MTTKEALETMIETLQLMQITQIKQNTAMRELSNRVVMLEHMNAKLVFMIEAVLEQKQNDTFH